MNHSFYWAQSSDPDMCLAIQVLHIGAGQCCPNNYTIRIVLQTKHLM